jgi:hypothetical protein
MSVSFIYHIKEERLRLTRKMVPRKIFGPKRGRVLGSWRQLRSEGSDGLCPCHMLSEQIIDKMGGMCSTPCGEVNCIEVFGGET